MKFFRQEYWSELPFSPPGNLPEPGNELKAPAALVLAGEFLTTEPRGKSHMVYQFSSVQSLSHVRLFATLWTVAHQASLSMGFSGQEYWSGLPFSPPGNLPHPGIAAPVSLALEADSLPLSR